MIKVGARVGYNGKALKYPGIVFRPDGKELCDPKRIGEVVGYRERAECGNVPAAQLVVVKWGDEDRELCIHPFWLKVFKKRVLPNLQKSET